MTRLVPKDRQLSFDLDTCSSHTVYVLLHNDLDISTNQCPSACSSHIAYVLVHNDLDINTDQGPSATHGLQRTEVQSLTVNPFNRLEDLSVLESGVSCKVGLPATL